MRTIIENMMKMMLMMTWIPDQDDEQGVDDYQAEFYCGALGVTSDNVYVHEERRFLSQQLMVDFDWRHLIIINQSCFSIKDLWVKGIAYRFVKFRSNLLDME